MQMKQILMSAVVAASAVVFAPPSHAEYRFDKGRRDCGGDISNVRCRIGGHFDDGFWDRWNFISCTEARRMLANRGYTRITTLNCRGTLYVFKARWKGKSYELKVARNNGTLRSVRKI